MSEPLLLRGFTSDLAGAEHSLEFTRPVVSQGDAEFVVRPASGAAEPHLRELRPQDRRFVRWLADDPREIELDDGLWIAGPELLDDLQSISAGKLVASAIRRVWAPLVTTSMTDAAPSGFYFFIGSYRAYLDLMQQQSNRMERALHRAFFEKRRGRKSPLARTFRLYRAFTLTDTRSFALNSVLYALETDNERARTVAVRRAIRTGVADDEAEIDRAVQGLRTRIRHERLYELSIGGTTEPSAPAAKSNQTGKVGVTSRAREQIRSLKRFGTTSVQRQGERFRQSIVRYGAEGPDPLEFAAMKAKLEAAARKKNHMDVPAHKQKS